MAKYTPGTWRVCSASNGNCQCDMINSDYGPGILVAHAVKETKRRPVPTIGEATGLTEKEFKMVIDNFVEKKSLSVAVVGIPNKLSELTKALVNMSTHAAFTMSDDEDVPRPSEEEFQANKKLIAAAPDLFEVCKEALSFIVGIQELFNNLEENELIEKLEKAIKKAENGISKERSSLIAETFPDLDNDENEIIETNHITKRLLAAIAADED